MGKTYIDAVKYVITASFTIDGIVEKPDIIGAIFGQTEGLVGEDLELRELQKNGKIGRIEVISKTQDGKTTGDIIIPSSLDKVETVILAAAVEAVDKVGPCKAEIHCKKIEDIRTQKRQQIVDRAKDILKKFVEEEMPESNELSDAVSANAKKADIIAYGKDSLPAGPDIEKSQEVILVEGRADVLTLLKNDIKNAIAIGGANVPETVKQLCKIKEITAFVDGDRGGDLIIKSLKDLARLDYVAKAPDGKEVEELTRKEIIQALRRKMPADQFKITRTERSLERERRQERPFDRRPQRQERPYERRPPREQERPPLPPKPEKKTLEPKNDEEKKLIEMLEKVNGSLKGQIVDEKLKVIEDVPVRKLLTSLESTKKVYAIVFDGIITNRLVELASKKGAKYVLGIKEGMLKEKPKDLTIMSQN
ncbi:MAG: DNA primase [Candidatus Diapherotrites archaeon]|nr:DNA primase [Candidatus Diapherotrites archaeon]